MFDDPFEQETSTKKRRIEIKPDQRHYLSYDDIFRQEEISQLNFEEHFRSDYLFQVDFDGLSELINDWINIRIPEADFWRRVKQVEEHFFALAIKEFRKSGMVLDLASFSKYVFDVFLPNHRKDRIAAYLEIPHNYMLENEVTKKRFYGYLNKFILNPRPIRINRKERTNDWYVGVDEDM